MAEKEYDLVERTFQFALSVRHCLSETEWSRIQFRDVDQLLRSSGSVAANHVEANNAVSKADFIHRIRIAKKEACESQLWIRLIGATSAKETVKEELRRLFSQADELVRILATIERKSSDKS